MPMTPQGWSLNALATELGLDRRTIAKRIGEAGLQPVEIAGKGRERRYRLRDVLDLLDGPRRSQGNGDAEMRRRLIQARVPLDCLAPWLGAAKLRRQGLVVPLDEFKRSEGLSDAEAATWLAWGLPLLPPARGQKVASVSVCHAQLWELGIRAMIQSVGGDGAAPNLARELERLAPAADDGADEDGGE